MNAPELHISKWFNTPEPLSLEKLDGKVVVMHAFQMLCPGCVHYGIPQMSKIYEYLQNPDLVVIGLHSVFEHHEVMTPAALEVFIHENKLKFPIGVDTPAKDSRIPLTMKAYGMQGTPSTIIIDRAGKPRFHYFGHREDIVVGAAIGNLLQS